MGDIDIDNIDIDDIDIDISIDRLSSKFFSL